MTEPDKLPEPDLSGHTLDRYHLLRRIGVGGMGAVYEAEHTRLRKRFAVKLLRYELASDEMFRKRFLREARAASAVSHPHVVAISDFGESDDGHVFFVMELLGGRDLQELLEAQPVLPWPRTREILLQVTAALQAAHQQDIIHRDIKPSNVFLADVPGKGEDDFVKVLDFGIAKISGNVGEVTAKLTSTDEIFGTVAYMAPEMAMGINDDRRSDIYAVGVMMFRMLTGMLPYTQGNAFQILSQHIHAPIPSLREKNPSIPEPVEAIVLHAMAKQPEERFATMEAFNQALRRGMAETTEVLVAMQTAPLAAVPNSPLDARPDSIDIDKTTPMPARAQGTPPSPATVGAGPSPSERGDSAAIPQFEPHTVVSTPIAVDAAAERPVPAMESGPVAVPVVEPTVALDSGSIGGATVAVSAELPSGGQRVEPMPLQRDLDEPRRSPLRWLLPTVGAAAVLGVVAFFAMGGQDDDADSKASMQSAARPETDARPEPDARLEPEPEPTAQDEGIEDPELVIEPEPTPKPTPEPEPPKPSMSAKPSSSKPKPPPRPRTDKEVVAGLAAKITAKCKGQLGGKVRVEGMINSAGKVEGLLVTPPNGLGTCDKLVKAAKFDPQGGVRPMPRFSVEP